MSCTEIEEKIALFVSGDLAPSDAAALENHLPGCPACRARLVEFGDDRLALGTLVNKTVYEADCVAMRQAVLARIEESKRGWGWLRVWFRPVPLAAAAALALAFGGWWLRDARPPVPVAVNIHFSPGQTHPAAPLLAASLPAPEAAAAHQKVTRLRRPSGARNAVPAARHSSAPAAAIPAEELAIRLETADPNVVIYWFVSPKGGQP